MEGRVMIIEKAKGLLIGEKVYRAIKKMIDGNENGDYVYVDTFNNCRETGYCFKLMRAGNPKQQKYKMQSNTNGTHCAVYQQQKTVDKAQHLHKRKWT